MFSKLLYSATSGPFGLQGMKETRSEVVTWAGVLRSAGSVELDVVLIPMERDRPNKLFRKHKW